MLIPQVRETNRFNRIPKPGEKFDISKIFRAHVGDGDPKPDEKYTLAEAEEKLKSSGYVVMRQKAFDDIIDEKYGKGFNKGKEEGKAEAKPDDTLKKENETLKAQVEELKKEKPDMISKSEHEKLLAAKDEQLAKKDEVINGHRQKLRDDAIFKAAAAKSVDPDTVVKLVRDRIAIDDNLEVYPLDEKGEGRLIDSGGHVSVDKFIEGLLKEKTYLAKDTSSPGAGSSTESGGKPSTGTSGKHTLDQLADMTPEQYMKSGGIASLSE